MTRKKHIIVAGSTGEVGKHLIDFASGRPDLTVHALVRRKGVWRNNPLIDEILFDYEDREQYDRLFQEVGCDALIIALGTTTSKAGVQGLMTVDRDYPIQLIEALERVSASSTVGFCSSAGADAPRGHYLKAKAEVEQRLQSSSLPTVIVRPSFLISEREEFRPMERIGVPVFQAIFGFLKEVAPRSPWIWKYAPVHARDVADRLLAETLRVKASEHVILEGDRLHRRG
jgi:uncharacterized protein YbjT (DUF2867 family)